jgi:hypothetical protein
MKKMITMMLLILVVSVASAQYKGRYGYRGGYMARPYTSIVVGGLYPFSPYYPYYGYPLFYQPGYMYRPSKLDLQVADIRHDFDDRIASVRMDENLRGKERREKIRELRTERNNAIDAAKRNYYKS